MTQAKQGVPATSTASSQVVIFVGDLDMATAAGLAEELGRAAAAHPGSRLLVDLAGVTFMDCAGLRPLLAARDRQAAGLSLRNPAPPVLRLLGLLGLSAAFPVVLDVPPTSAGPPAPLRPGPLQRLWRRRAHIPVPATPDRLHLLPHPAPEPEPDPQVAEHAAAWQSP